jgi:hypothetical protein
MGRLQTIAYRAPLANWPKIRKQFACNKFHNLIFSTEKYGILEDPDRLIRLYQSGAPYFRSKFVSVKLPLDSLLKTILSDIIPCQSKFICITIDAQKAAELGVMFFHTSDVELLAVGKNGAIPVEAIRSVVELEVTKQSLI